MVWEWLYKLWTGVPTEPVQEARQQRLNKTNKIQTGLEAVLLNSISDIDRQDREAARIYRNKTLFGGGNETIPSTEDDGLIIADDIRITNVKPSPLLPLLLTAGLAGAGVWLASEYLSKESSEKSVETRTEQYDYRVQTRVILPDP